MLDGLQAFVNRFPAGSLWPIRVLPGHAMATRSMLVAASLRGLVAPDFHILPSGLAHSHWHWLPWHPGLYP